MSGWSITLAPAPNDRDLLIADLWDAGTTGITEDEDWLRAFFDRSADRDAVLRRFGPWHPQVEDQDDHDWVQHAQSMWRPFALGERWWLAPEWTDDPAPDGRLRLTMHAGMASGSGLHPATQLCLLAFEKVVKPGVAVLDVGTGSGILAQAALLLGASRVVGCDIDADATNAAHSNVPRAAFFTGSLRSVQKGAFDIAVGNLNPATIGALAHDLRDVAPTLIVSGFKEEEVPVVRRSLGRPVNDTLELDGWACLIS